MILQYWPGENSIYKVQGENFYFKSTVIFQLNLFLWLEFVIIHHSVTMPIILKLIFLVLIIFFLLVY